MKHESIVVVYDSCQAIAEEIADKLGAETVSVQSLNNRQVENCQSLVLAVEFQADGPLSPHWQYACQMLRGASLNGKNIAVMVAQGNSQDNGIYADAFFSELRQNGGAHRRRTAACNSVSSYFINVFYVSNITRTLMIVTTVVKIRNSLSGRNLTRRIPR